MNWILISCERPRLPYQVFRFVEGHKLAITCTKRGIIRLHRLVVIGSVERFQRIDKEEQGEAIEAIVNAGYNIVEAANKLRDRARSKKG